MAETIEAKGTRRVRALQIPWRRTSGLGFVLLVTLVLAGPTRASATEPVDPYQHVRALLAQVHDAPVLVETVHSGLPERQTALLEKQGGRWRVLGTR